MSKAPGNSVFMNIKLKNRAGAVWFWQAAAEISFSFSIHNNRFIASIEAIRYTDRHGKIILLQENSRRARDRLRFAFLAEKIEQKSSFTAAALQAARAQNGPYSAPFKAAPADSASYPGAGARAGRLPS